MYKLNKIRGFVALPIIIISAVWAVGVLGGLAYEYKNNQSVLSSVNKNNLLAQVSDVTTPTITVLSPNGGETFNAGEDFNVNFRTSDIFSIRVTLYRSDNWGCIMTFNNNFPAGDNSITLNSNDTVCGQPVRAGQYKIRLDSGDIRDDSDDYITIAPSPNEITCTDSDGGWNYNKKGTAGIPSAMKEDYCTDNRTVVEYACANPSSYIGWTGAYTSCPNGCEDGACIAPSEPPSVSIFQADIVTSSEQLNLNPGEIHIITWKNIPVSAYPLNLKLINNSGAQSDIVDSISSLQSEYMWQVPTTLSNGKYKIKLIGANFSIDSDQFGIVPLTSVTETVTPIIEFKEDNASDKTVTFICNDVTKTILSAVGGCSQVNQSKHPNVYNSCCTGATVADQPRVTTCNDFAKSIVNTVGGCGKVDPILYTNVHNACCTSVTTTVAKETLLAMLDNALADGVIDNSEKTNLLTALDSYLGQ